MKHKQHLFYYFSLAFIVLVGFVTPAYLSGQKTMQLIILVFTACFYVIWGVVHHMIHHSFSIKIVLEYIAIAVLGISLILFAFNVAL